MDEVDNLTRLAEEFHLNDIRDSAEELARLKAEYEFAYANELEDFRLFCRQAAEEGISEKRIFEAHAEGQRRVQR